VPPPEWLDEANSNALKVREAVNSAKDAAAVQNFHFERPLNLPPGGEKAVNKRQRNVVPSRTDQAKESC